MKQLLILMGTMLLGGLIFQMMAGDSSDSLKYTAAEVMKESIGIYAELGD